MNHKSTRFAGPFIASVASLALFVPAVATAQSRDKTGAKSPMIAAVRDSALKISAKGKEVRRDGRPKDGPRDTGIKRGQDTPTSP